MVVPLGGLRGAVEATVERSQRAGLPVRLNVRGPAAEVGPEAVAVVSRVLGEALANVERHAGAAAATVELRIEGERLELVVEDDGHGFDPAADEGPGDGHFGLSIMRERARGSGGECSVGPRPGGGTRVRAEDAGRLMDVGTALDGEVGAGWCPHLAILVPSAERVIPALASFYGLGARRNGLLFHRALPGHGEADRAGLTAAGLDVAALEGTGRLVVAEPPQETDPERWARPWVPVVEDALEHGFDAVWFSRFPIGPNEAHLTAALAFDRAWDDAFHGRPAVSLCVYIVDDVDEAARARRLETLAPFHDGVVVPDARGGAELVQTRERPGRGA